MRLILIVMAPPPPTHWQAMHFRCAVGAKPCPPADARLSLCHFLPSLRPASRSVVPGKDSPCLPVRLSWVLTTCSDIPFGFCFFFVPPPSFSRNLHLPACTSLPRPSPRPVLPVPFLSPILFLALCFSFPLPALFPPCPLPSCVLLTPPSTRSV